MTEKLSVKLRAQVRVVIYEVMPADRKSLLTEKQQEITLKSVARELRAKRFKILLKHLHSECSQDLIFLNSNVGKGCAPSSL